MAMFMFERIRADVVALVVLVLLGLTGLVASEDIFSGFSSDAVINVIATMILGAGLDRTGALNRLASWLLRRAHGVEQRLRSEEHTSELQSLMRISYAVFSLQNKKETK